MGRGKIEIRRIENSSNRQVTYSKRRNGIIKKAKEISVLCDSQVSVIIFSTSGKMHEFCSPSVPQVLTDMLEHYHKLSGKRLWDAKHEHLENEINKIKKENDNMQIELRHLKGDDIATLNYKELMLLEEALSNGISTLKAKQMELVRMIRKHNEMMEEENQNLQFKLRQLHLDPMNSSGNHAMDSQGRGQEIYNPHGSGGVSYDTCTGQMPHNPPFAFRLQPSLPDHL